MNMRYRIIANPVANKGGSEKILPGVEKELKAKGLNYDLVKTRHAWHAADLAQQAVAAGYDVVVAAGGDGTVNEVINGLLLAKDAGLGSAALGVIPIGQGNDFCFGMGLPTNWKAAIGVLAQGQRRLIDVGYIRGGLYPAGRFLGNGAGIGFDASVNIVSRGLKLTGFLSYFVAALKTLFLDFHAPKMEIILDNQTLVQETLMVSIMNGRRMGGGFLMTPQSQPDDGLFDICVANKTSPFRALTIIPSFFNGTQAVHKKIIHFHRSQRVTVRALTDNLPCHADGEVISTRSPELSLEIVPGALELIVPPARTIKPPKTKKQNRT